MNLSKRVGLLIFLVCAAGFLLLAGLRTHWLTWRVWSPAQELLTTYLEQHPEAAWNYPLIPALDGLYWTDMAHRMVTEGEWRIRETQRDNAPTGRTIYWSSLPAWGISGLGGIWAIATGEPWAESTLHAAIWSNPVLMVCGFFALALVIGRRISWVAAGLFLLATQGFLKIYYPFELAAPDHHGWFALAYAAHLLFLGLTFRGTAWSGRDAAISGIFAGVLLWLGATQASLLLGLSGVGILFALGLGRFSSGSNPPPVPARIWAIWGAAGALTSLLAYFVEYAPANFGVRLEVNHPLYSLALLSGGVALCVCQNLLFDPAQRTRNVLLLIAATALAFLPAAILLGTRSPAFHAMLDPVIWRYHQNLSEFGPLFQGGIHQLYLPEFVGLLLICALGIVLIIKRWRENPRELGGVAILTLAALVLAVAGFFQNRWFGLGAIAGVVLIPLIFGTRTDTADAAHCESRFFQWAATGLTALLVISQIILITAFFPKNHEEHAFTISGKMVVMLLASQSIQETLPPDRAAPVVLLYPTTTDGIGQLGFSGAPLVASQYWENGEGIRDALEILASTDHAHARELLQQRGVTHLVLARHPAVAHQSVQVWTGEEPSADQLQKSLAYRLIDPNQQPPAWIELILTLPMLDVESDLLVFRIVDP